MSQNIHWLSDFNPRFSLSVGYRDPSTFATFQKTLKPSLFLQSLSKTMITMYRRKLLFLSGGEKSRPSNALHTPGIANATIWQSECSSLCLCQDRYWYQQRWEIACRFIILFSACRRRGGIPVFSYPIFSVCRRRECRKHCSWLGSNPKIYKLYF